MSDGEFKATHIGMIPGTDKGIRLPLMLHDGLFFAERTWALHAAGKPGYGERPDMMKTHGYESVTPITATAAAGWDPGSVPLVRVIPPKSSQPTSRPTEPNPVSKREQVIRSAVAEWNANEAAKPKGWLSPPKDVWVDGCLRDAGEPLLTDKEKKDLGA